MAIEDEAKVFKLNLKGGFMSLLKLSSIGLSALICGTMLSCASAKLNVAVSDDKSAISKKIAGKVPHEVKQLLGEPLYVFYEQNYPGANYQMIYVESKAEVPQWQAYSAPANFKCIQIVFRQSRGYKLENQYDDSIYTDVKCDYFKGMGGLWSMKDLSQAPK